MFFYNVNATNIDGEVDNTNGCWNARFAEDGKTLVVEYKDGRKFYVDGFHDCFNLNKGDKNNVWYSFNPKYNDFHIVPGIIDDTIDNVLNDVLQTLNCKEKSTKRSGRPHGTVEIDGQSYAWMHSWGSVPATINHRWVVMSKCNNGEYEYLLSFNRLTCAGKESPYHIYNYFGRVQFMRYQKNAWTINRVRVGKKCEFKMLYPNSAENGKGQFDRDSGHLTYNAPFTIQSCPQAIAKAFAEFVRLGEQAEKDKEKVEEIPQIINKYCEEELGKATRRECYFHELFQKP